MLNVVTLEEARSILHAAFGNWTPDTETVPLSSALGRVLAETVTANEFIPAFSRSTVDGYALCSTDTFGCSESIPALLACAGAVEMGQQPQFAISSGQCAYIPTGGCIPSGADSVVMVEQTEAYPDGTIGVYTPCPPGNHMILRGDDIAPGKELLPAGRRIADKEIGALAAAGVEKAKVFLPVKAAVLSTGDELIPPEETPKLGQVRDVNGPMLAAALEQAGCTVLRRGLLKDDPELLQKAISESCADCNVVFLSGGSSVGVQDAAHQVLENLGRILFHGLAVKPGKPTLLAEVNGTPVFGLPGNPAAAWFVFHLLAEPWLRAVTGQRMPRETVTAQITQRVPSNHGREEYVLVHLQDGAAVPLWNKSGLITAMSRADGYLCIPRDVEGVQAGSTVTITIL